METPATVGIFGGTGFESFLDHAEEMSIDTPYGPPSSPPRIAEICGQKVAFISRHGNDHSIPPHKVPYRANVWAMRKLGVQKLFGPCAVGSAQKEKGVGDFVVADQIVQFTNRDATFFDGPQVVHTPFAEPYCPDMRARLISSCNTAAIPHHETGTVVTMEGPRYESRAELVWFHNEGWDVLSMTQYPEVPLSREAGICFGGLAIVTNVADPTIDDPVSLSHEEVVEAFNQSLGSLVKILEGAISEMDEEFVACDCRASATGILPGI